MVVPLASVSRLARDALSQALSISSHVIAVTVIVEDGTSSAGQGRQMEQQWARWDPGVPLQVLRTEYASVAAPIAAFADELGQHHGKRVLVLIPVTYDGPRHQLLHNHLDLALTAELLTRPHIVTARIQVPPHLTDSEEMPS